MGFFSVGSPKLLAPIISSSVLTQLTPNFSEILAWSLAKHVNGLYVYTHLENEQWLARGFNPKTGHNEDAATGVAAAALALALNKNLIVNQGISIDKPSQITVTFNNLKCILVGGHTQRVSCKSFNGMV